MSTIAKFYDLEARKISADGEKISLFTKHPGTLGAFREARLRQYISEHTSSRFAVTSGFISKNDPDSGDIVAERSRQIDCLVYADETHSPLLRASDFAIVPPEALVAAIEIKSNLTLSKNRDSKDPNLPWQDSEGRFKWDGTLIDALQNVRSTIAVLEASGASRDDYFVGILGYEARSIGQFVNAMTSGEIPTQIGANTIDHLPNDISVFDGPWFGFSAFEWLESPEQYGLGDSDPAWSYLLEGPRCSEGGSLQLFTAGLDHVVGVVRSGRPHAVGGLRSGRGYGGLVDNHKLNLPSARQHATAVGG